MDSDELVYVTVTDGTKTPGARGFWGPESCIPPMPYFVYRQIAGGEFHADNDKYTALPRYRVTVYAEEQDDDLEATFGRVIAQLGPYSRSWEYDSEHDACVTHFDFTLARRAE